MDDTATPAWPVVSFEEARRILTAPGMPFEMETIEVDGRPMRVYVNGPKDLRQVFELSRQWGHREFLIYEGERVHIWVAHDDKSIELRQIKTGLTNGNLVEVVGNLKPGEQIVTRGSLFIDRAASGS